MPRQLLIMTHAYAKGEGKRSVSSKDRAVLDGWTDVCTYGHTDACKNGSMDRGNCIISHANTVGNGMYHLRSIRTLMLLLSTVLLQVLTTQMPQTTDSAVYKMQQYKHPSPTMNKKPS